ncbi:S-layer homology domain-containing protein [Vallitalea guaymasensis]|uniref:S-layer homology domain-containing protein n=1 Tax=Vallitalea guaymasensis TaxID=1185412 RepID=UPI000DE3A1EE|nr:S-layer homology domain-containing protein [Vallitalea guaymasensis]
MIIKNIKKVLYLIIAVSIICNINIYASEDKPDEAIEYINGIREKVSVRSIENSKQLESSAANHSKYMSVNNNFSLIEESGNKYYRGRYSWDRASYYSYFNPYITEFINNNLDSYKNGVVDLINNPYSRISFLDPLYQHIGMGSYKDMYTYDLGGKSRDLTVKNKKIVIYPYDKMENVPITWENNYKINPYRDLDIESSNVGLPITLSYYSDKNKIRRIYNNDIKLENEDKGFEVKTKIILPQDDKYIDNSLIILPLKKLEYNTNYQVSINVDFIFQNSTIPSEKKSKYTVNFKTEAKDNPLDRAKFTEYLVKALKIDILEPKEVFKDIDIKSNDAKYIYTAYKNDLVSGFGDDTFRPNQNITKEQVYTLLIRAYEKENGEIKLNEYKSYSYSYHSVSNWAVNYMKKAEEIGLLSRVRSNELKGEITESEYKRIINLYQEIYNVKKDIN